MATIIALVIAAITASATGFSPEIIEQFKNDFIIKPTPESSHHRLAGWQMIASKNVKCDMVRRNIKTFGYCWKDDENAKLGINTAKERGWVREVIQQWEKCGGMRFVEEPRCRSGPDFVTIKVGNYQPAVSPMIDYRTCQAESFDMTLDFYTFGVNIEYYRTSEKVRKSNIQMYALHEFGHFLGFDHEHNRSDRKGDCYFGVDQSEVGPNPIYSHYYMTAQYDLDSIMNYCRPNVHYKPWLSKLDKQAVAAAYGGGNAQECEAVTKPWVWNAGEGIEKYTLEALQKELGNAPSKGK